MLLYRNEISNSLLTMHQISSSLKRTEIKFSRYDHTQIILINHLFCAGLHDIKN